VRSIYETAKPLSRLISLKREVEILLSKAAALTRIAIFNKWRIEAALRYAADYSFASRLARI